MIKTLRSLFKQDKEKFVILKSVQAVILLKTMWEDGIFLVGRNKYAKTFKFDDINYAVASREDDFVMQISIDNKRKLGYTNCINRSNTVNTVNNKEVIKCFASIHPAESRFMSKLWLR